MPRTEYLLVKGNNWLGDAVMSLPTIAGLRAMRPQAKISVLTREGLSDVYEGSPAVDEILAYRTSLGAIRRMRSRRFDSVLLLPRSFKSALLAALARIPRRIGYASDHRASLLTTPVPRNPEFLKTHRVYYFFNLLRGFGDAPAVRPPQFPVPGNQLEWARERISQVAAGGRRVIGLNPGAAYGEAKRWQKEGFIELGKRLAQEAGAALVVFGGTTEIELGKAVARGIGRHATSLAGQTSIPQLAALLRQCELFVTNDTGPMHLADAVGTPIIAVFGPTDPLTTRPFGRSHIVVRHPIECAPCLERICPLKHHQCMESITENEVLDACWKMLRRHRR